MESIILNGYLSNYGLCIKKKDIKEEKTLNEIKKYFNVTPKDSEESKSFEVCYEDLNYLVLPKFISSIKIKLLNKNVNILFNIKKYSYHKEKADFSFSGILRDYQLEIVNYIINIFDNSINKPKGGIISLSCGGGKTIIGIYLAFILKLKTLIIVHQDFLLDQWMDRFKTFTNAKIGIIKQNIIDIENKDIVIGMLQSISLKDYDENLFKQFGLVIYDEVHHLGSKVFSQTLLKTSAEYTIGLSATPNRNDGLLKVIKWHVGDILYQMKKKYNYRVLVKKIHFRSQDVLYKEQRSWIKINNKTAYRPCLYKMEDNLIQIKSRNKLLLNMINTLKCLGRKIFIFSTRVEHLENLKTELDKTIEEAGESHIYNTYYYMGKTKKGERKMAEKYADIIFATLKLAEEGLDISILDTIIFALPFKNEKTVIQSIGRILRKDTLDIITQIPLVIDISDILSVYSNWSNVRNTIYGKENWYIQNYYFCDDEYLHKNSESKDKNPMNIIFDDVIDDNLIIKNIESENIEKPNLDKKQLSNRKII